MYTVLNVIIVGGGCGIAAYLLYNMLEGDV